MLFFARRSHGAALGRTLLFAVATVAAAHAQRQTSPAATQSSITTQPVSLSLTPGQTISLSIGVAPKSCERLSIEQTSGSVEARLLQSTGTAQESPRTNPAGLQSSIVITLSGPDGDTPPDRQNLTLHNLSASKPATVVVTPGPSHPPTPADAQQIVAESAFTRAEAIRAQRSTAAYPEALRLYDQAIAVWRTSDPPNLARALSWKALFLFVNQNDAAAALPLTEEARGVHDTLSPPEVANVLKIAGYVNVQLGKYDAGAAAYTAALQLFEQTGDLFNQEVLLDNRSRLERLQGNNDAALADAGRADLLAAEVGDLKRQAKIKAEIGAIHLTASRLKPAYVAYQEALALLKQSPDAMTEGYVWSDLGVLYTLLHEFDEADGALAQASSIWARSPNPTAELNTLDDLGELSMSEGKLARARAYYESGLARPDAQSLPRPRIYLLRGLGATHLLENDLPHARQHLDQALALALATREGDSLPEIYCLLGDLHVRRHEFSEAAQTYGLCGSQSSSTEDEYSQIRAHGSLARMAFEHGDRQSAAAQAERALEGIEAVRSTIPEQHLRTSFFSSMHAYYDLEIEILLSPEAQHVPAEAWRAFLTAERARSRMLLDAVPDAFATRSSAAPPPVSALQTQLRSTESALRQRQVRLAGAPAAKRASLRSSIAILNVERDALSARIAAEVAESSGLTVAPPDQQFTAPLTLASVQSLLPSSRSVLLEYWTGRRSSYLWAITRSGVRCFPLPPAATLDAHVRSLLHSLLAVASVNPDQTAEQRVVTLATASAAGAEESARLRRVLFPPGALPPHPDKVLVVADGPLLSLPFNALISSAVLSEPSVTFLRRLQSLPATTALRPRIAVFPSPRPASLQELPFALTEARSIQTAFGTENATLIQGESATPEALEGFPWATYTIAHFASHATLNWQNMQLSGLVLDAAPKTPNSSDLPGSSTLWYSDICRMHVPLELVVLSACGTATGQNLPGEGLVGLTQAFFIAGARRVLATLWPVDDEASAAFMRLFYTALAASHSPADSLRGAQKQMAAAGPWRSPYYWAGFSLAGDWRALP